MDLLGTWGKRTQDWLGGARRSLLGDDLPPDAKRAATVGTMGPGIATQMQGLDTAQRAAVKRGGVRDLLGDPEVQARATDVASNLDFTGTFGGVFAKGADLGAHNMARRMKGEGKAPEEIWEQTGWFQGPDKKWRFEIDDSKAQFSPERLKEIEKTDLLGTAGEVMSHPDLYAAYPNLEKAQVGIEATPGVQGQWKGYGLDLTPNRSPGETKGTMLHELQHGIQDKEGFASGGSLSTIYDIKDEMLGELYATQKEINKLRESGGDTSQLTAKAWKLRAAYDKLESENPFNTYRRLAGEAEARLVEKRRSLTPEERRVIFPSYDVPPEQQIVRGVR